MTFTRFMDMHSGGGQKEQWSHIFIEAPQDEAVRVFYARFGHNPSRVTCTCCGDDYSISENESLAQLTGFDRGCEFVYFRPDGTECRQEEGWQVGKGLTEGYTSGYAERHGTTAWRQYRTIEEYLADPNVLLIKAEDILPVWRNQYVPEQGYVWVD